VGIVVATTSMMTYGGVVATDGNVPSDLYPGGTAVDPAVYVIGETAAYTRDYGSTPLYIGYNSSSISGYSYVQLFIQNGSTVYSGDDSSVGAFWDEGHRLVRLTSASSWNVAGTLNCPDSGNDDRLEVFGGSWVTCVNLNMGGGDTGDGAMVVSNANSRVLVSGNILDGANNAYSEATIVDHALVRVDGTSLVIDKVNLDKGFLAWKGDHTSENQHFTMRGWNGTSWQDYLNTTKTYYATDAEAKLATSDPDDSFAGYDDLGGYTIYTASIPGEETVKTWSARDDFVLDANPNAEWSYGGMDGSFSNFTLGYFDGDRAWVTSGGNQTGWIWTNNHASVEYGVAPGQLALHPWYNDSVPGSGAPSLVRWTAPAFGGTGQAHVVGKFYEGDSGAVDNRVSHNSTSLWDQVTGDFDLIFDVKSGDTIDFIVYGTYSYANTPLDAFIELSYTEAITNTLVVVSEHGTPVPARGTNEVIGGSTTVCSVDSVTVAQTNYTPSGWTLVGQEPASGNTNWFELTSSTNATLTWNWKTNYWLEVSVVGSGSVDHVSDWYEKDTEQILTATPDAGWLFMGWSGAASGTNEAFVMMIEPKSITATFSDDADGDGLSNTEEATYGSDPWKSDTDGDGFDDGFEVQKGLSPTNDDSDVATYIQNHDSTFGLYPSNVVLDVAVGQILLETASGNANLNLQLEQSEDLQSWTNAGNAVEWVLPVGSEKKFFRVRSEK